MLAPGLIDMRVFVGEPGAEHRETLASASEAAAAGGVTTFVTMPTPTPPSTSGDRRHTLLRGPDNGSCASSAAALTGGEGRR